MRNRHLAPLMFLLFAAIFLVGLPSSAAAACVPGDIVISGADPRSDTSIDTCGSITITSTGSATWSNVTVLFNSSAIDGHGLYIDGSASFQNVRIFAPAGAAPWVFTISSTATNVVMEGSDFGGMWGTATDPGSSLTATSADFSGVVGGVQIYSTDVRIGNSTLHDGRGTNLYVGNGASPRINNNLITNPWYVAFEYFTIFTAGTQSSQFRAVAACVVLASGNTDFDTNRVERCGADQSANVTDLGTQNATIAISSFAQVGAGVVVLGGSPGMRQDEVRSIVPIASSSKSFTLGNVSVTHAYAKLAAWGLLFKNAAGVTLSGGFINGPTTAVAIVGNSSYAGGVAINYDFYQLTVNGSYTNGLSADFRALSSAVTLGLSSCSFGAGGSSAVAAYFNAMNAAHTVAVAGGTIDLNGAGTGIRLEAHSSSARPTFTVGSVAISHTRAPVVMYFNALTGGATAGVDNNTITDTAGIANGSVGISTRGGIDVQANLLTGSTLSVLIEDNRVWNQTWQLGGTRYPGLTYSQASSSAITSSLSIRRNVFSNVSYGMYLYDTYGSAAQNSFYTITGNRVETSSSTGGYLYSSSNGGSVDPSFDRNVFDRSNGWGFEWLILSGNVAVRTFGNNTVTGTTPTSSLGFRFYYGSTAKWSLNVADSLVFNGSQGLQFQQVIANVYRTDLTGTGTAVVCQDCVARIEESQIYPLSATVNGINAEVTVLEPFGSPRVQWQGDGGLLVHSTNLYLRWYGPLNALTLATISLDASGSFAPRPVAAWRVTSNFQDQYANVTPVIRLNNVDIIGIPVPFITPFNGNLTILDPDLPSLTFSTPSRDTQLREPFVKVKGNVADQTTGVEVVQISIDGVNFVNVTTRDPITGAWEHEVAFPLPADGVYNITIRAWDRARWGVTFGNFTAGYKEVIILGIVVDTIAPLIFIDTPSNDITTRDKNIPVIGRMTDVNAVPTFRFSFNGGDLTASLDGAGNFRVTLPDLKEGPNLVSVLATDKAGNTNLITRTITLDTVPPFVLVHSPLNNSFTNRAGVQIVAEVEAGVGVRVNNVAASLPYPMTLNQGENRIWINATDGGGNNASYLLVVTLDRAVPTVTFTEPARFPLSTNSPRVVIAGRANEPLLAVFVNNVSYPLATPTTFSVELYLEDGVHALSVRLVDLANNSLEVGSPLPVVTVDTQAPVLRIDSPQEKSVQRERNIAIRGRTDAGAFVNVTTPSGVFAITVNPLGDFSFDDTRTTDGVFVYSFRASDGVGNLRSTSVQITVDGTPPRVEVLGVGTNQETTEPFVRLHGTVSPGSTLTVNGEPVAVDCPGAAGSECVYDFNLPLKEGTNTVSLLATDSAGNTGLRSIFVLRNPVEVAAPPPQLGPYLLIAGIVVGAALLPFWIRRYRAEAAAKHPGLVINGAPEARAVEPQAAPEVPYEPDAQDMYATDAQARGSRRPRPPRGGM